jgi:Zn-dependent peptidase ImmA (M78 family)
LPEWWNDACSTQSELMPDVDIRIARFLGLSLADVKNPDFPLAPTIYENAHLRRVRFIDEDRLAPAIHSALKIGAAVVRNLRNPESFQATIPSVALKWRHQILKNQTNVTLDVLLKDLWDRGIPVVPIEVLPTPTFQGMACFIGDRPIILLGQRHDEPGHLAFIIAHEAGHIAAGDCAPGQPVIDEEGEIDDDAEMERGADNFAKSVLLGSDSVPDLTDGNYKQIAKQADQIEQTTGADASLIIYNWARQTRDYKTASMAAKALYISAGARRNLRRHFDHHVNLDAASETDRALLRCVYRDPE